MTPLQQCAFNRLRAINKDCYALIKHKEWKNKNSLYNNLEYHQDTITKIIELLSEQDDLLYALNAEDEKDYEIDSGSGERTPKI